MIKRFLCCLADAEHRDEVRVCMDMIFRGHSTEDSIRIFNDVRMRYEDELIRRQESNNLENSQIRDYFMSVKS